MNDTELDELLDAWKTPDPPASLQKGVRARLAEKRRRTLRDVFPGWKMLVSGAAVAAVAFVLAANSAFPQLVRHPPYTVDSEITLYPGTPGCRECFPDGPKSAQMRSYNLAGSEVILSWSVPGHPFDEALWTVKFGHDSMFRKIHRLFMEPDLEAADFGVVYTDVAHSSVVGRRTALVNSGCRTTSPDYS